MATIKTITRTATLMSMSVCAFMASAQSGTPVTTTEVEETVVEVVETSDTTYTGFNALDYVLQRPNDNIKFTDKKFSDRMFMTLGVGPAWFHNPERIFDFETTDFKFNMNVGNWFTPVHGWSVGLNAGIHHLEGGHKPFYVGISADYLANLSALVRGDNPSRKFEIIGSAGLEYQLNRHCDHNYNVFGFRLGLQGRWNFSKNIFAYVEPRIGGYFGPGISHGIEKPSEFHYRIEPAIMFGIGLRRSDAREIREHSDPFTEKCLEDHMFYEVSVGWFDLKKRDGQAGIFGDHNMDFTYSAGKWFTPQSALRLNATYGKLTHSHEFIMAGIDYVWNITSAFTGYRVHDKFELDLTAGVSGIYVSSTSGKFYPGLQAGLKAIYNITPNWGVYVEPRLHLFGRRFNDRIVDRMPLSAVNIGLRYTIGDFKYDYAENLASFREQGQKHSFITASVGPARYKKIPYSIGCAFEIGYGRWFSPMSAWRVAIDAQTFPRAADNMNPRNVCIGGDYILSISSALCGYNPHRFFDFSGSVGAYAGIAQCPEKRLSEETETRFTGFLKAAFIGRFRITESLSAIVQTQAIGASLPLPDKGSYLRPEMRLMLGAHYAF